MAPLLLSLTACTTHQQGDLRIADDRAVRAIKVNTSTKADVKALLGAPKSLTTKDEDVETWEYKLITSGVSPETYIPIVGLFMGRGEADARTVAVTFNRDGVVTEVADKHTVSTVHPFGGVQVTTTPP